MSTPLTNDVIFLPEGEDERMIQELLAQREQRGFADWTPGLHPRDRQGRFADKPGLSALRFDAQAALLSLKRLGTGQYQTKDGRFGIQHGYGDDRKGWHVWDNQSGEYVGSFKSLREAKASLEKTPAVRERTIGDVLHGTSPEAEKYVREVEAFYGRAGVYPHLPADAVKIPVNAGTMDDEEGVPGTAAGGLKYDYDYVPEEMRFNTAANGWEPMGTMAHEFAHYFDSIALGEERKNVEDQDGNIHPSIVIQGSHLAALEPDKYHDRYGLLPVMDAIIQSEAEGLRRMHRQSYELDAAFGDKQAQEALNYIDYLEDPVEQFARAVQQYLQSRNHYRMDMIDKFRASSPENWNLVPIFWGDSDFRPISKALDKLFDKLGWRVPVSSNGGAETMDEQGKLFAEGQQPVIPDVGIIDRFWQGKPVAAIVGWQDHYREVRGIELADERDFAGRKWTPGLHPRWPKGTPVKGGKFMTKGEIAAVKKAGGPSASTAKAAAPSKPGAPSTPSTRKPSRKPSLSATQTISAREAVTSKSGIVSYAIIEGAGPDVHIKTVVPPTPPAGETPVDVGGDVEKAAQLIFEGKAVELNQPHEVAILLDHLAAIALDAEKKKEKAPKYDLCKVTLKGASLFCVENVGASRAQMPQLGGFPKAGSPAEKFPRIPGTENKEHPEGGVDLTKEFLKHLRKMGITTKAGKEHAAYLKASQNELEGVKVAGIMKSMREKGVKQVAPMLITEDGYIVDGHHRWAALVGLDSQDNRLGDDKSIEVTRINMSIVDLLLEAKGWTTEMGIPPTAFGAK